MTIPGRPFLLAAVLATSALAGCDSFPKDPDNTTEEVQERGAVRVGLVGGGESEAEERLLAEAIASEAGVTVEARTDTSEALMYLLEEGEIDLVIGEFADKTPWSERAAFTIAPGIDSPPKDLPVLRAAVPLGENRWLMLVSEAMREERQS
ncbi:hypothetical protein [Pseudoroseicyclus tamaricis]|uniref:Uncharacterized protein n=1 Tax=Pseudoroseicyclus tamaricis TaxID=2705421 RepID=A0A6B2K5L6_9RHOB|nr:hypothetical protein [Pseudoroseicyclus tamaricis]NDV02076.1 hypothetical protein [Pseudoroseicyclus tamaricis]